MHTKGAWAYFQERKDIAPRESERLEAEIAAHAETRSKLASLRQNLDRKTALLADAKSKLEAAQAAATEVNSSSLALQTAEQQLKDANCALARKDQRIREVCTALLVHLYVTVGRMVWVCWLAFRPR
jgi:hypothetical protein